MIEQLQWLVNTSKNDFHLISMIIGSLFAIHMINVLLRYRLNVLGLYPRTGHGFLGIFFSHFLHGSFTHLIFNCIPLFILLNFILLKGINNTITITLLIMVISGLCVWLFGRKAIHVGASGLIMGYWGFLLIDAIQHPSVITIFLVLTCLYYFGGFVSSLLPEEGSSWEGHFFGFLAGLAVSYFNLTAFF
jgi:membrane associated rhomboid family serine protease